MICFWGAHLCFHSTTEWQVINIPHKGSHKNCTVWKFSMLQWMRGMNLLLKSPWIWMLSAHLRPRLAFKKLSHRFELSLTDLGHGAWIKPEDGKFVSSGSKSSIWASCRVFPCSATAKPCSNRSTMKLVVVALLGCFAKNPKWGQQSPVAAACIYGQHPPRFEWHG